MKTVKIKDDYHHRLKKWAACFYKEDFPGKEKQVTLTEIVDCAIRDYIKAHKIPEKVM